VTVVQIWTTPDMFTGMCCEVKLLPFSNPRPIEYR